MTFLEFLQLNPALKGVDEGLSRVFFEAQQRGAPPFGFSEGMRSPERQREMVEAGKSQTMDSRHLHGNAVDIHLFDDEGNPDWTFDRYGQLWGEYINPIAEEMGVPVEWGGNWKSLKDGVHFQLARDKRFPESVPPMGNPTTGGGVGSTFQETVGRVDPSDVPLSAPEPTFWDKLKELAESDAVTKMDAGRYAQGAGVDMMPGPGVGGMNLPPANERAESAAMLQGLFEKLGGLLDDDDDDLMASLLTMLSRQA